MRNIYIYSYIHMYIYTDIYIHVYPCMSTFLCCHHMFCHFHQRFVTFSFASEWVKVHTHTHKYRYILISDIVSQSINVLWFLCFFALLSLLAACILGCSSVLFWAFFVYHINICQQILSMRRITLTQTTFSRHMFGYLEFGIPLFFIAS